MELSTPELGVSLWQILSGLLLIGIIYLVGNYIMKKQ